MRGCRISATGSTNTGSKGLRRPAGEADEKFNIIGMVCTGSMLRIFPYTDPSDSLLRWASQVDDLPRELPHGQALFIAGP